MNAASSALTSAANESCNFSRSSNRNRPAAAGPEGKERTGTPFLGTTMKAYRFLCGLTAWQQ